MISVRGIIRVGRFLSQTQTSSSRRLMNGYAWCGTTVRSSRLQRYVASGVRMQYRKRPKTAWYSFLSWSSRSASYSSRSSRLDIRPQCSRARISCTWPFPGTSRAGSRSASGSSTNRLSCMSRMRDPEPRLVDLGVPVEQQIEVERPRPLRAGRPRGCGRSGARRRAAARSSSPRRQLRLERRGAVEEARLVDVADRLRVVEAGDRDDVDPRLGRQRVERREQRPLTVAEVRAEGDVGAGHRARLPLRWPPRGVAPRHRARGDFRRPRPGRNRRGRDGPDHRRPAPGTGVVAARRRSRPGDAAGTGRPAGDRRQRPGRDHAGVRGPAQRDAAERPDRRSVRRSGTARSSRRLPRRAANGVGIVGVYPQAALEIWDASPVSNIVSFSAAVGIETAAQHCPTVISLSFGSREPEPADRERDHLRAAPRLPRRRLGGKRRPARQPAVLSRPARRTCSPLRRRTRTTPSRTSRPRRRPTTSPLPGWTSSAPSPLARPDGVRRSRTGRASRRRSSPRPRRGSGRCGRRSTATQLFQLLRSTARDVGPPGFDPETGFGILDIPAALAAPTPPSDPLEPNDDIDQVKPGGLFHDGQPAITTAAKPSVRLVRQPRRERGSARPLPDLGAGAPESSASPSPPAAPPPRGSGGRRR